MRSSCVFGLLRRLALCSPLLAAFAIAIFVAAPAAAQTSFTGGAIALQGNGGMTVQLANSTATVSGISGSISKVTVTLNTLNGSIANGLNDFAFLLVPPAGGTALDFLNGTCDSATNVNLTFDDAAVSQAPSPTCTSTSGTFKPTTSFADSWPGITNTIRQAPTFGTSTFGSVFDGLFGTQVNGTWTLYISDQFANDCAGQCSKVSIASWTLNITASTGASTSTSITPSSTSVFTGAPGNSLTLTATVTSTSTVNGGTVAFFDGINQITCGGGSQVVSNGTATCTTALVTEGVHSLTADYSGASGFGPSGSAAANVTASNHTQQSGNQYCNTGTLTSGDIVTSPLPSHIFVGSPDNTTAPSGGGLISTVTLKLNSLNTGAQAGDEQQNLLLVGPNGGILVFAANGGTQTVSQSLLNLSFADTGTAASIGTALASNTTYRPFSFFSELGESQNGQAAFPTGTPSFSSANEAASDGTATFETVYTGSGATGAWSLYYSSTGNGSSTVGGWCLDFTMSGGAATTTSVTSTAPTALTTDSFNVTATVNSATEGSVTFVATSSTGAATPLGSSAVTSGHASVTVSPSTLTEGTYEISADFADPGNAFGPSHGSVAQRINTRRPRPPSMAAPTRIAPPRPSSCPSRTPSAPWPMPRRIPPTFWFPISRVR